MKQASAAMYLKWEDQVIGTISPSYEVTFSEPAFNQVVSSYTHGKQSWNRAKFMEFLAERIVSRDRRDIERVLFRCGLSQYNTLEIAKITKAMHPKDLLWITENPDENMEDAFNESFDKVFRKHLDTEGQSPTNSPEGFNIKRYGVYGGKYGIYKKRIGPLLTDVESEVAVYNLAKRLGIDCCPAFRTDKDIVFSMFLYDFSKEYIVHFRRLFPGPRGENEYENLLNVRPQYREEIIKMLLLDFMTRQDDRHLSNIAVKINSAGEQFYPLYDNGRSLFYEDTDETVESAVQDIPGFSTTFGMSGTYFDHIQDIVKQGEHPAQFIDLSITKDEIAGILRNADFKGYRLEGAIQWISGCIGLLKEL